MFLALGHIAAGGKTQRFLCIPVVNVLGFFFLIFFFSFEILLFRLVLSIYFCISVLLKCDGFLNMILSDMVFSVEYHCGKSREIGVMQKTPHSLLLPAVF